MWMWMGGWDVGTSKEVEFGVEVDMAADLHMACASGVGAGVLLRVRVHKQDSLF